MGDSPAALRYVLSGYTNFIVIVGSGLLFGGVLPIGPSPLAHTHLTTIIGSSAITGSGIQDGGHAAPGSAPWSDRMVGGQGWPTLVERAGTDDRRQPCAGTSMTKVVSPMPGK
jgi:hypothetical protein